MYPASDGFCRRYCVLPDSSEQWGGDHGLSGESILVSNGNVFLNKYICTTFLLTWKLL